VFNRVIFIVISIISFAFLLLFVMCCDSEKHYKTLSYFFDGVPSPDGEVSDSNTSEPQNTRRKRPEIVWYVHEPYKVRPCKCHGKDITRRSFYRQVESTLKVPELCYECHTDYSKSSANYVHGPVAVGYCLFRCHSPHQSKIPGLLLKPIPELCYDCHDVQAIEEISAHSAETLPGCIDCHQPHESSIKGLLKDSLEKQN
jgi:predicted CXXCH cytochrome family protein